MRKTPRSKRATLMRFFLQLAWGALLLATGRSYITGWSWFFVFMGTSLTVIAGALMVAEFLVRSGAKSPRYRNALPQDQKVEPPIIAEFLVGLCAKHRYRNGLLQSLEDDFERDLAAGTTVRRARSKYWAAALNSIGPQLLAAAKRIGIIGLIADYARRLW
jgi:hypothetical protein